MVHQIIQSISPMTEASSKAISDLVAYRTHEKGSIFIEKDKMDMCEYFLVEGICRSFLLNPDGEEVTISFFNAGSIISPHVSRTSERRSKINFEALTNIKLGVMDATDFEQLMVENLEVRHFGNVVLRNELMTKVDKEINLATQTAAFRLKKFRADFPQFENLIPHPAIASYIGVTPISLSRLRKELAS
jgi:CRP-like cAMP-binding protein